MWYIADDRCSCLVLDIRDLGKSTGQRLEGLVCQAAPEPLFCSACSVRTVRTLEKWEFRVGY